MPASDAPPSSCRQSCSEKGEPASPDVRWAAPRTEVHPGLVQAIERAARTYRGRTGEPVTVVSGRRSLRRQAELMAAMSDEQLTSLYSAAAEYVQRIIAERARTGRLSAEQVYRILCTRSEGYISRHLWGAAVDLAIPEKAPEMLITCLRKEGLQVLDERNAGIHCFHVAKPDLPVRIVTR